MKNPMKYLKEPCESGYYTKKERKKIIKKLSKKQIKDYTFSDIVLYYHVKDELENLIREKKIKKLKKKIKNKHI